MNCYKGVCKYKDDNICRIDNMACDYSRKYTETTGTITEHCKQENNKDYMQVHHDCFLMKNPPLEPFFSCYNLCKYYDTCDET